jgi:polyisoprenoid-binding protein YceI
VGDVYILDPAMSCFTVQAFATGFLSRLGHNPTIAFRDYTCEARLAPEPSLRVRIDAASFAVTDRVSENDRSDMESTMRNEVLEIARYPEILYRSTKIWIEGQLARIQGELVLHGVR